MWESVQIGTPPAMVSGNPTLPIEGHALRLEVGSLKGAGAARELVGGESAVPAHHPPPGQFRFGPEPVQDPSYPPGRPGLTRHGCHGAIAGYPPPGDPGHDLEHCSAKR